MASLETTCERLFRQEGAWRRTLFGGLLCLSIIGIPWAAGYLFRYALKARTQESPELPEWKDYGKFWLPGWHFLAVFAAWCLLPGILALVAGILIETLTFGILWWGSYIVTALGMAIAPALCISALTHYQSRQEWGALIEFGPILSPFRECWPLLVIPTLLWAGLIGLFTPLLPFAFFLGFLVLLAYYTPLFLEYSKD